MLDRVRLLLLFLAGLALPQEYVNLEVGGMAGVLTLNKVASGLLLLYVIIHWMSRGTRLPSSPKHSWLLVFFLSVFVSTFAAGVRGVEIRPLVGVAITWVSLFLFYFVIAYATTSVREMDVLYKGLAVGSMIVVLSTFVGVGRVFESRFGERTGGAGGNPNMLAFNMCTGIPIFVIYLLSSRRLLPRLYYVGAIGMALAGIVISLSRGGALALGAMGAFWIARTKQVKYAIPAMLAALIFLALAPTAWFERVGTISLHPKDRSAKHRLAMLPSIFHAFGTNPVIGVGISRFVPWTYEHDYSIHHVIHNAYLEVLAEQGLLGFLPFIAIHFLVWQDFGRSYRLARRLRARGDPQLNALGLRALMLQTSLVAALVIGLFSPSHAFKALWMMFAMGTVIHHLTRVRAHELLSIEEEAPGETGAVGVSALPVPSLRA
jgi:O-antigen ligase